jgi:ElaB/YqjD/DUF883 family membrane-anchored ribosome-binding protein
MMKQSMVEFKRTQGQVADDVNALVADSGELLKAAAAVSGDGLARARGEFEEKLGRAKASLTDASRAAVGTAREGAAAVNNYAHGSPWTMIGIAAAAGVLIGIVAARR